MYILYFLNVYLHFEILKFYACGICDKMIGSKVKKKHFTSQYCKNAAKFLLEQFLRDDKKQKAKQQTSSSN